MVPGRQEIASLAVADVPRCRTSIGDRPVLRTMTEQDIRSVAQLISRAMNPDEGRQALDTLRLHFSCRTHAIDDGRTYYILSGPAQDPQAVVGLHHYLWGPPENVWLAWFAVDPRFQGQGLGKFLLEAIIQKAKQHGYMKLFIETYATPDFSCARAFYEAHGFVLSGRVSAYLPDGGDMLVYAKELTPNV